MDGEPCCPPTPVLIDVAGDGISLTSWSDGVNYAMRPGYGESRLSWTAPEDDDAWLVMDRNGNGVIDNGREFFGNFALQPPPAQGGQRNGFAALAAIDTNYDGVVDAADHGFDTLRLWQDKNHDGVSQADELLSLGLVGVSGISVVYATTLLRDIHGNEYRYSANVYGAAGSRVGMTAWDVVLVGTVPTKLDTTTFALTVPADGEWWCSCQLDSEPTVPEKMCYPTDGRGSSTISEEAACTRCCTNAKNALPWYCQATSCDCNRPCQFLEYEGDEEVC